MIEARYFDGLSARARAVRLSIEGDELVAAMDEGASARWPLAQVRWPERTRHGQRIVHLPGGGQLDIADAAAFDAWRAASGVRESWVVRVQQHWRATLAACLLLLAVLAAGYRWGVPWAADTLVAALPAQADGAVGDAALADLRSRWLGPSQLPAARQQALREAFAQALAAAPAADRPRAWALHFHSGGKVLGANAFALPGGNIVVTDEMVALLEGHDDSLVGVLGHEAGHVVRRHGMRALARAALVGMATSVALGDFSTVLAGVPAALAHLSYSRDAEREADAHAARLLVASGRSPQAMVLLFERLAAKRAGSSPPPGGGGAQDDGNPLPIALASHPLDAERVRFFREFKR
ncbi:MAG: M48 family metallopeptidase [Rubrivivax sp.]|nr:M48 family metallopeptidase [Rubrivivax sp.]